MALMPLPRWTSSSTGYRRRNTPYLIILVSSLLTYSPVPCTFHSDPTESSLGGKEDIEMATMRSQSKIVMHACPRCQGDLMHDEYEGEYRCLQCGRRADLTSGQPVVSEPAGIQV